MNIGLGGFDPTILLLAVPLLLVELGLLVLAVADLLRDDRRVRGGSKPMWALIIVFVNLIGPILYFLVGRDESPVGPVEPGPGAVPGWGSPHDPPIVARTRGGRAGTRRTGRRRRPLACGAPYVGENAGSWRARWRSRRCESRRPLPEGPAAIRIEGLSKRYPGGVLALDALTMSVPTGSVFGLLGPNGAGKTTCLRLLAGLTRRDGGEGRGCRPPGRHRRSRGAPGAGLPGAGPTHLRLDDRPRAGRDARGVSTDCRERHSTMR